MIFITGDMHADKSRFKQIEKAHLKKDDTLIICGDFGFVWGDTPTENSILDWIGKKKYNVVFVDGYYDNTERLLAYPQQEWNGGQTKLISNRLRMLMRGEVFLIEGKRFFAFGGGDSSERENGSAHDALKLPSEREMTNGYINLTKFHNAVDFVITHDAPAKLKQFMDFECDQITHLNQYLDNVMAEITFKHWYFGKYHQNKIIPPCYTNVFTSVTKILGDNIKK